MSVSLRSSTLACLGWALLLVPTGTARAADDPQSVVNRRLTVHGNGKIGAGALVVAELKGSLPAGLYAVKRDGNNNGTPITGEVFDRAGKSYIALPLEQAEGDGTSVFTISGLPAPTTGKAIAADQIHAPRVQILAGGKPFTTYITNDGPKPYYYPVVGPTGASYTRGYPMETVAGDDKDHPHQRSFWFTHGKVNGFDFWASDEKNKPNPKFGSYKETSRAIVANGYHVATMRTTDDWLGPDGKKVCDDERLVSFYSLGKTRVIDFDITIRASAGPVTFGDTKEGMFGVRVASSMDVKNKQNSGGKITNAEGLHDDAAWGKASPWVDYVGQVQGKTVGVAILNHRRAILADEQEPPLGGQGQHGHIVRGLDRIVRLPAALQSLGHELEPGGREHHLPIHRHRILEPSAPGRAARCPRGSPAVATEGSGDSPYPSLPSDAKSDSLAAGSRPPSGDFACNPPHLRLRPKGIRLNNLTQW